MNRKQFAMIDNGWFLPLVVCLCVGVSNSLLAAFNVLDYGAKADGVHDDAPAIQAAIDAAIATGKPATVLIPKGTYHLKTLTRTTYPSRYTTDWQKPVSAHMLIANASELSIIGEPGTRLLMGVPNANGIRINHSNAVTLKQLVIDYDPLPFTQGTISNVDHQNAVFTWQRHDGFPSPTQKHFLKAARRRGSVFEAATGQLKANTKDTHFISQIQELGQDQFVFHVDRQQTPSGTAGIDPGDRFVMLARGGGAAIAMWHSQCCQAQQVTVHSSPTVCFAVIDSHQMAIDQCIIKPLPGRLLSTNADGVHCKVNRTGPRVTNCNFSAMSDDAVNICGRAVMTYEQPHPDQLLVEWIEYLRAGDRVVLVDQQTGRQTVEAVIRDIKPDHWQNHRALRLTFDHPLGDVLTQSEVGSELVSNKQRAAMAAVGKKVDGRLPDLLVNLNALGSGFEISGNTFGSFRGRGCMIRSWNGVIQNNRFDHISSAGIIMGMALGWPEVYHAQDIIIRNNQFQAIEHEPSILTMNMLAGAKRATDAVANRRIQIINNTFANKRAGHVIVLHDAAEILVQSNHFESISESVSTDRPVILTPDDPTIQVMNNHISDPWANPQSGH